MYITVKSHEFFCEGNHNTFWEIIIPIHNTIWENNP